MASGLQAEDLYRIEVALEPAVCRDDSAVAFVLRAPNPETRNDYVGTIKVLCLREGGTTVDIGIPGALCHSPKWSPDGKKIAFLAPGPGGADQLWLWVRATQSQMVVTQIGGGVLELDWAPDSCRVVVSATVAVEGGRTESDLTYITTIRDKVESQRPWSAARRDRRQLLVVDVESRETTQITSGPWDHYQPAWSPTRDEIAFVANRSDDPDPMVMADLWVVEVRSQQLRRLTGGKGPFGNPRWSADGGMVAAIGHEYERGQSYQNFLRVWTVQRDGTQRTCVTRDLDATCSDCAIGDLRAFGGHDPGLLAWSPRDGSVNFLTSIEGTTQLMSVDPQTHRITSHTSGNHNVYAFAVMHESRAVVVAISTPTSPCNLWLCDPDNGVHRLTSLNAWLEEVPLSPCQPLVVRSRDGRPLDAWVMKPVGCDDRHRYAAVMQVHRLMYGATFLFECQLLAARGFVVFFMNQHGSFGYGQDFAVSDWGEEELTDLVNGLHALASLPFVDPTRIGVCGGSNGGYLTYRLLAASEIPATGVAQRGMSHFASFFGTSDIGYHWTEWILGGPPWAAAQAYRDLSPLFSADRIRVPLLIVHSDCDTRVPIEQAETMFVALKRLGRTVALARFHGEGHDLSRTGKPVNRVARLHVILEWFGTQLGQDLRPD